MLRFIVVNSIFPVKNLFKFVSRIGIILHEMSHIIFIFLSGGTVKSVELFRADGGKVSYAEKDYIASAAYNNYDGVTYFIFMLASKIGFFIAQIGPLIVGILVNIIYLNIVFQIPFFSQDFHIGIENINIINIIVSIIYLMVFVPTFIPSWKDLSNIFFYNGTNIIEKIIGSIINIFFVLIFLIISTYFINYLLYFFYFYLISFGITMFIYICTKIYFLMKNLLINK
ncbi:MAG: hypothetical protein V3575_06195 [Candidatus Absconditabacteria bacterium]